jgi:exopolyphosphatase / guanosine-5'-triphosphate,3'-diphosphate pyrophosphatase
MLTLPRETSRYRQFLAPIRADPMNVVPRWEWRVFGTDLSLPNAAGLVMTDTSGPDTETYLLTPRSTFSLKVRDGHLEVKRLEAMDHRDLELWRPIHRFPLPLTPDAVATVCVLLGLTVVELVGPCDLQRLVGAVEGVTVVPVVKRRWRFVGEGFVGEHTTLTIGDEPWTSIAVEGEDPDAVYAGVRALGLETRANLNYPRALKLLSDLAPSPGGGTAGQLRDVEYDGARHH